MMHQSQVVLQPHLQQITINHGNTITGLSLFAQPRDFYILLLQPQDSGLCFIQAIDTSALPVLRA
jgi:hypothetical protein